MGYGNCVLVNDTPENREVAGEAGLYFDARQPRTLAALLGLVLADDRLAARQRALAAERARERYSWDAVTDRYVDLFERLCG
jgi:glycosyltransferase involved in cell wall biosynthesis